MKGLLLVSLFFVLFPVANAMAQSSASAVAVSCPNIRLDQGTNSMAHVAVRDQGSVPNCFAHVAAEIVDAWRFSHGDNNYAFQSSGLNLGFDYWGHKPNDKPFTDPDDPNIGAGGNVPEALSVAEKYGVCNKASSIEALNQSDIKDLFQTVQSTIMKEQKEAGLPSNKQTPLPQDKTAQNFGKYISKFDENAAKSLHETEATAPLPQASSLVSVLRDPNADSDISEVLGQACDAKARLQVSYPASEDMAAFLRPTSTVIAAIRTALSRPNPQPVGLSLCSEVLYESENFRGRNANSMSDECMSKAHAVIAIGARPSGNSCQYLIRSSWGQSCAGFGAGWSCDENSGSVWINEDALIGNLISYSFFEDQAQASQSATVSTPATGEILDSSLPSKNLLGNFFGNLFGKPSTPTSHEHASEAPKDLEYRVEKNLMKFYNTFEGHLLVSKNCTLASPENCEATKVLKSISYASLKNKIYGDVNPGAVFCNQVGGKEQLGVDKDQNENMFCRFSDNSLVACSSLLYFALLNDRQLNEHKKNP